MFSSAVILASASSSSWVSGRSRWAPLRRRGASWRSCRRRLVFRVCSLVDCRTDFRAKKKKNADKGNMKHNDMNLKPSGTMSDAVVKHSHDVWFEENLLSPKSWNSCGILLLSSTLVFSVFFVSTGFLGLGLGTLIGSFGLENRTFYYK